MRYRLRRIRKPQIFTLLMILSAVFVLLPREYFGPARNLVMLVSYLPQTASTRAMQAIGGEVKERSTKAIPADEHDKVIIENKSIESENVVLRQQVAELRGTVAALGAIRSRGFKEGVLVPASVIALDAAGGRDSLLLGKGRLSNLKKGDWVASRLLIGAGGDDGITDQAAVLAGQCLIGWIEDVSPVNARVVLLSDPVAARNINVSILPPRGDTRKPLVENEHFVAFGLEGMGNGRMRVLDIFHDYVERKQIVEGDYVACLPSPRLPAPLVIGRIEKLERMKQKPVYFIAIVAPIIDPKSLEQVFVVDLSRPAIPAGH